MAVIQAKWTKVVEAEVLQRSSQVVSVIDGQVYIFGGELRPREPRDNNVHIVSLGRRESPYFYKKIPNLMPAHTTNRSHSRNPIYQAIHRQIPFAASRDRLGNPQWQNLPILRTRGRSNGTGRRKWRYLGIQPRLRRMVTPITIRRKPVLYPGSAQLPLHSQRRQRHRVYPRGLSGEGPSIRSVGIQCIPEAVDGTCFGAGSTTRWNLYCICPG